MKKFTVKIIYEVEDENERKVLKTFNEELLSYENYKLKYIKAFEIINP